MNKKTLITVLCVIVAVLIAALISSVFIQRYHTPEKALERMFSLRADMKLEDYYNCFDIPEESKCYMNSLEAYLLMAEEKEWTEIKDFEIIKKRTNSFVVKYGETEETLELIKQTQKSSLGFDTYKIKIESVSSPLIYIATLHDADISVDGISINSLKLNQADVEDAYLLTNDDSTENIFGISSAGRNLPVNYFRTYDDRFDNYCFTNVFDREYKICVTTDYTVPFEIQAAPSEFPYLLRDLQLSEESEREIKELGESFMVKYYYAIQNGDDFETILPLITSNEEQIEYFRNDYEDLYHIFTRGETVEGIIDICFLDAISTVNYPGEYSLNQKEYEVNATLDYSYNAISYDGVTDEYEYHNDCFDSMMFSVSCVNENGKWVVYNVDDTLINYIY